MTMRLDLGYCGFLDMDLCVDLVLKMATGFSWASFCRILNVGFERMRNCSL